MKKKLQKLPIQNSLSFNQQQQVTKNVSTKARIMKQKQTLIEGKMKKRRYRFVELSCIHKSTLTFNQLGSLLRQTASYQFTMRFAMRKVCSL